MPLNHGNVREFLDLGEGDPPPVFVGRGEVLADILDIARRRPGRPKVTRVIQGAPGAGKTAILREMRKRWTGADGTPRVVTLSRADLVADVPMVVATVTVGGTMDHRGWLDVINRAAKIIESVELGIDIPELARLYLSFTRHPQQAPKSLKAAALERKGRPRTPAVVAVDETQSPLGSPATVMAAFLQSIHDGDIGQKLTLVLAGLSDTAARASKMHLTRGTLVHEIGCLRQWKAQEFMERLCGHLGLNVSRHLSQLHELVDRTEGWPRHLHFAAVALARAPQAVDGDPDRIDWRKVEAEALASRHAHYQDQRIPEMRESKFLAAAVMTGLRPGMERGDMLKLTHDSIGSDPRRQLPDSMTPRGFFDHLVEGVRCTMVATIDSTPRSPLSGRNWSRPVQGLRVWDRSTTTGGRCRSPHPSMTMTASGRKLPSHHGPPRPGEHCPTKVESRPRSGAPGRRPRSPPLGGSRSGAG